MIHSLLLILFCLSYTFAAEFFYLGSYTDSISKFTVFADGWIEQLSESINDVGKNPSWLVLSNDQKYLYAVNEVDDFDGLYQGAVSSFSIDKDNNMQFLSRVGSGGASPAHLLIDSTDSSLYISNYCSGSLGVVETVKGVLQSSSLQLVDHNPTPVLSCDGAHVHQVIAAAGGTLLSTDLGLSQVFHYGVSPSGHIQLPEIERTDGPTATAGCRHITLHPTLPFAFLINELESTMSTLLYNRNTGSVKLLTTVSTLPAEETNEQMAAAEVKISPDGRFVYGSNRDISSLDTAHNRNRSSIVVFRLEPLSGALDPVQFVGTRGVHPRHFEMFFEGNLVLVANLYSDNIVSFFVDKETGFLTPTGYSVSVSAPTHLLKVKVSD